MANMNKKSLAALICGILGLVGGAIPGVRNVTFILSIVAIVLGKKGMADGGATAQEKKYYKIGMWLGVAGVVITIIAFIIAFAMIGALM